MALSRPSHDDPETHTKCCLEDLQLPNLAKPGKRQIVIFWDILCIFFMPCFNSITSTGLSKDPSQEQNMISWHDFFLIFTTLCSQWGVGRGGGLRSNLRSKKLSTVFGVFVWEFSRTKIKSNLKKIANNFWPGHQNKPIFGKLQTKMKQKSVGNRSLIFCLSSGTCEKNLHTESTV